MGGKLHDGHCRGAVRSIDQEWPSGIVRCADCAVERYDAGRTYIDPQESAARALQSIVDVLCPACLGCLVDQRGDARRGRRVDERLQRRIAIHDRHAVGRGHEHNVVGGSPEALGDRRDSRANVEQNHVRVMPRLLSSAMRCCWALAVHCEAIEAAHRPARI